MEGAGDDKRAVVVGQVKSLAGQAIFSNVELEQLVTAREIRDRNRGHVLTPADGQEYVLALPRHFTGEELFAIRVAEDGE